MRIEVFNSDGVVVALASNHGRVVIVLTVRRAEAIDEHHRTIAMRPGQALLAVQGLASAVKRALSKR